jgi:acyl-coenzyme A thioesterase PaaI-like protein
MTEPRKPAEVSPEIRRVFEGRPPGRLMNRGHPVGDFLEAHAWDLLEERRGFLRLRIHLPAQVKNPRGQLFGGFTPTYVDLIALLTCRAGESSEAPRHWLATTNMHVDYLDPITDDFRVESRLLRRRGRTCWVETRFLDEHGALLANALTTLREVRA